MATKWLIVFLATLLAAYVSGKLEFVPQRHEIRLHYNAPPDLLVTQLKAVDPDYPDAEIQYSLHNVLSYKYFSVERQSGNVYTKDYVYLRIGQNLTIMVVGLGHDQSIVQQLHIRITEYNREKPTFEYDIYRTEISYTENLNTTLLRVQARDNDSLPYNAELYYSILPTNWSEFFTIDLYTGDIKLQQKLTVDMKLIQLSILVEDGGSPIRVGNASVEIAVKAVSEPRRVRHKNSMGHSVEICWDRPLNGIVIGYLIRFRESGASQDEVQDVNITLANVTHEGASFCTKLRGLKPWTDYEYRVYAWNNEETGLGSDVSTFGTRSNYCLHQPCRHGRCIPTINAPGFTCDCDSGWYGTTCNHFNPCIDRPCGEYGECDNTSDSKYVCRCMDGFSGDNCSIFDPCLANPCRNGATCTSNSPNTYQCMCSDGYYGRTCTMHNPCSSNPCANDGVCKNVSRTEFKCYCVPGYQGKQCEIDIDECISSPCFNRATCIDKNNSFECVCQPGFTGNLCNEIDYCKEEQTIRKHGTFRWSTVGFNQTLRLPCPSGPFDRKQDEKLLFAERTCVVSKNNRLVWSEVNSSQCKDEGFQIATNVTRELNNLTASPRNLSSHEFEHATRQIENVYSYALHDKKIAGGMLSVISNMLDVEESLLDKDNESSASTARLVDVVKKYASSVTLEKGRSIRFRSENLVVRAINWKEPVPGRQATSKEKRYDSDGLIFFGNKKYSSSRPMAYANASMPTPQNVAEKEDDNDDDDDDDDDEEDNEENIAMMNLPSEVLQKAKEQRKDDEVRVQFISFKNAKFFRRRNGSDGVSTPDDPWQPVIIASIDRAFISNLSYPVTYAIPTSIHKTYVCAFWDEDEKKWSRDGISTNQTGNVTICHSTHLTAFSVLFDPDPHSSISSKHKIALSIVSYVGCALSTIGLLLTILTYSLFRCLNRDRSGKILLSLCVAMLLMNVSFLVGSQSHKSRIVDICVSVAILTHYFLLCTLAWMCVEAINMYQMLIYVFASAETRFMLKRSLAAWGIPFIIVSITAGIDVGYYYNKDEYCMLSPNNPYVYYITFLGPSCLILLINCVVFILVTRVLFQPRASGSHKPPPRRVGKEKVTFAQVRGAFTVMTLLGVTWVFGALAIGPAKVAFQYLFCVLNSLQGFIIFVVRCIQYPEARSAWTQLFRTGTLKKYRGVATVSISSHSQYNNGGRGGQGGGHGHSQTSRTASAETSSSMVEKERKLSVASLTQFLRQTMQRRRSSAVSTTTTKSGGKDQLTSRMSDRKNIQIMSAAVLPETTIVPIAIATSGLSDVIDTSNESGTSKEGRDTQWQYYCCSMKKLDDFQREFEAKAPLSTPLLSGVNADDLPFIEDEPSQSAPSTEAQTQQQENSSQTDQGYSSLENSPNSSRILPEATNLVMMAATVMNANPEVNEVTIVNQPRKSSLPTPTLSSPMLGSKLVRTWGRRATNPCIEPILDMSNETVLEENLSTATGDGKLCESPTWQSHSVTDLTVNVETSLPPTYVETKNMMMLSVLTEAAIKTADKYVDAAIADSIDNITAITNNR